MNESILSSINSPSDLKKIDTENLDLLAKEIRERIIHILSKNGGHLASNLGIVELTIALHRVFDSPDDKILFDTSHQAYTHKILTGRNKQFPTLRTINGISGFTHPAESPHDHFYSGHAGAAFSSALGLAQGRDYRGDSFHVLPIVGDASFTCGLTLEALNNIPKDLSKFIVILNDNKMAISKNVGNFKNILSRLINNPKTNRVYLDIIDKLSKIPNIGHTLASQGQKIKESVKNLVSPASFFEHFGLSYVGPIDGHDIKKLIDTFDALKSIDKPVIVHVLTKKGKGLESALNNPTSYHGVKPFDALTGKFLVPKEKKITFPQIFGSHLTNLAENDEKIIAVTPAMLAGSCLSEFKEKMPNRCLDVGIAEGHCITFAGGLSYCKENHVVACVYSSFLQRAFDNIFHDICMQKAPIVIAIDRAGLSGPDGTSHHGIYDISFLNAMPNLVIAQPRNGDVLKELLNSCFCWNKPLAIRYPNLATTESQSPSQIRNKVKGEILKQGKEIAIIALGHKYIDAEKIRLNLMEYGISPTIVDPVFVKPLDEKLFRNIFENHKYIITIEEHSLNGGLGSIINTFACKNKYQKNIIFNYGIDDNLVPHGSNIDLTKKLHLDAISITEDILTNLKHENLITFGATI